MFKSLLSLPQAYLLSQHVLGAVRAREKMLHDYGKIQKGLRILDIGCGPGFVVKYLGDVQEYIGFDISSHYIRYANKKYGSTNIHFRCELLTKEVAATLGEFDLILMNGLLHHLNDQEVTDLLALSKSLLKPGGRVLTLDGCFTESQNKIDRWLLENDRGLFVRNCEGYTEISKKIFSSVNAHLHRDYMHVPYTLLIQELHK